MDFNVTIIGAGVVGLAIANELSAVYDKVVVIEKNDKFGQETSSRNSEVIHSGIYYPQNSLKALLCVKGQKLLYEFCEKNEIPNKKCGKYIVATNEIEANQLEIIFNNAVKNSVVNPKIVEKNELAQNEPNLLGIKAIHFPETGIIDSYQLMKTFEKNILNNNANIVYNSEVYDIDKQKEYYEISIKDREGDFKFSSKIVINSAGLFSDKVSAMVGVNNEKYKLHFWKGEYFSVGNGKNKMVKSLIYPVPNSNVSLGIHATLDINGAMKLGPSAFYITENEFNYKVDEKNKIAFYESAKKILPFIELEDLNPYQSGIRPKLSLNKKEFRDFIITNEVNSGYKNFVNLIGIESPGLTSCLSIAEYVKKIIL